MRPEWLGRTSDLFMVREKQKLDVYNAFDIDTIGLNTFRANTLFDLNASSQLPCWSAPPACSMLCVFCDTFSSCHLMTKSVEADFA